MHASPRVVPAHAQRQLGKQLCTRAPLVLALRAVAPLHGEGAVVVRLERVADVEDTKDAAAVAFLVRGAKAEPKHHGHLAAVGSANATRHRKLHRLHSKKNTHTHTKAKQKKGWEVSGGQMRVLGARGRTQRVISCSVDTTSHTHTYKQTSTHTHTHKQTSTHTHKHSLTLSLSLAPCSNLDGGECCSVFAVGDVWPDTGSVRTRARKSNGIIVVVWTKVFFFGGGGRKMER